MRKVSAIHEAIAGDDIYTLRDGEPLFLGVKLDMIKTTIAHTKLEADKFPLSLDVRGMLWHMSNKDAHKCFGLQAA